MKRLLGPVDAAWLHTDRVDNPMVITAVLGFPRPIPHGALKDRLLRRLVARWPAFRRKVVDRDAWWPRWEEDPHFELDAHLHRVSLAPGGSLQDLVGDLASPGLDLRSAPWQVTRVDGVGDGMALVVRVHHSLADGVALATVLLSLTDEGLDAAPPAGATSRPGRPGPVVTATQALGLLLLPDDPPSSLRGSLSLRKGCAWTGALPLEGLRAAGRAHGGTVNDVLLAALAGALRDEVGEGVPAMRAFVPVDVRRGAPVPPDLGNAFTMVLVDLPVGQQDPLDRLHTVHETVRALRDSPQPAVIATMLGVVGRTPPVVQRLVVEIMGRKGSLVVTNVRGPSERRHVLGVPLEQILVWVPQAGAVGLGVALASYAGEVRIGVAADHRRVRDPAGLVAAIERQLLVLGAIPEPAAELRRAW